VLGALERSAASPGETAERGRVNRSDAAPALTGRTAASSAKESTRINRGKCRQPWRLLRLNRFGERYRAGPCGQFVKRRGGIMPAERERERKSCTAAYRSRVKACCCGVASGLGCVARRGNASFSRCERPSPAECLKLSLSHVSSFPSNATRGGTHAAATASGAAACSAARSSEGGTLRRPRPSSFKLAPSGSACVRPGQPRP